MQVPGLALTDPLVERVTRSGVDVFSESVAAEMVVHIENTFLMHHDEDANYKPYLHMRGRMLGLVPQDVLPGDVDTIRFQPNAGSFVDVFYDFTDDQLVDLISKGYFSDPGALEVPDELKDEELALDVEANVVILLPDATEDRAQAQVPVVFVDVPNKSKLMTNAELSGYDFAEFFRAVDREKQLQREQESQRTHEHENIFEGMEMDDDYGYESHEAPEVDRQVQLRHELETGLEHESATTESYRVQPEQPRDERNYERIIAPAVEASMSNESVYGERETVAELAGDEVITESSREQIEQTHKLQAATAPEQVPEVTESSFVDDDGIQVEGDRLVFEDDGIDDEVTGSLNHEVRHAGQDEHEETTSGGLNPKEAARRAAILARLNAAEQAEASPVVQASQDEAEPEKSDEGPDF